MCALFFNGDVLAAIFLRRNPSNQCEEHAEHDCITCCISEIKLEICFLRNLRLPPGGAIRASAILNPKSSENDEHHPIIRYNVVNSNC